MESSSTAERRATEMASIMQASQIKKAYGSQNWFAGQYIGADGRLCVVVTDVAAASAALQEASALSPEKIESIDSTHVQASPSVRIVQAKYSLKELLAIMSAIDAANPEYVYAFGISQKNNHVYVELATCDEDTIAKFRSEVVDSPALSFEQSDGIAVPLATFYAGSVVWPTSGSRVTISTFGYKDDEYGFVTVAHILSDTIRRSASGSVIGTTLDSNKVMDSTADGSWTKLNDGHTGTSSVAKVGSTTKNYDFFASENYEPQEDATVYAYLGRSGTVDSGTVTSIYHGYTCGYSQINSDWNNIKCYDIHVDGIDTSGGDSGSPLLFYLPNGRAVIWGLLRAGQNNYGNFCNIETVLDKLGVDAAGTFVS